MNQNEINHENMRRHLWCDVAAGVAASSNVTSKEAPINWANKSLEGFDERFPKPIKEAPQSLPVLAMESSPTPIHLNVNCGLDTSLKKKANELVFLCRIKRDGSGVEPVDQSEMEGKVYFDDVFNLRCLSLTEKTYIANSFNSYVVKLK